MKVLALDYGTKRVGVAVSTGSLAQPLTIIAHDAQLLPNLQRLIHEYQPDTIVIGLSENTMATRTREFARQLSTVTDVPLAFTDETLSSHEVHELLRYHPRHQKQGPIDHYAAAVILQRWLDEQGR